MFQGGDLRRNAFSVEQSWGQKVWFDVKSNVPDNSIDEDKYKNVQDRGDYEISKGKAATTALNALQLTL